MTACTATMLFDVSLLLLILKHCRSLRNYDADADPSAFARLHARVTHSPALSPAPSTPSQTSHRHQPQKQQEHSSTPVAAASALSSLTADSDSPLRPEHLAHPKEVDTASPSHQSESAQDLCCTHDAAEHHQEAASHPTIMLALHSPSSSSAAEPAPLAAAALHPLSQSSPEANDANGSRPSHAAPGCSSSGSSGGGGGGGIHISDIEVVCLSPASRTSSRPLSSMSQSGRLRATGGSYAEISFKAAARPLKDSANAARQQVDSCTVAPRFFDFFHLTALAGAEEAEE